MAVLTDSILSLAVQADPGVWFETETKIRAANGKLEVPRMNVLQRRINALFKGRRRRKLAVRIIGLKPRKRGFSTMVSAIHYTELCKHTIEGVIVGNKLDTSATVFRMMRVYSENDGLADRGEWARAPKPGTEQMRWDNGSLLTQSTAMGTGSIRGQTPNLVHGTEVAHWEGEEETFLAMMNAVPDVPESCVFLESTPKGKMGRFAQTWAEGRWPEADECPDEDEYWRQWEALCPQPDQNQITEFDFVRVFAAWYEFEEAATRISESQRRYMQETIDAASWYRGEKALIEAYGNTRASDGKMRLGREVQEADVWEQLYWRRQTIKNKCNSNPKQFDQEYPRDPESCFLASGNPVFDEDSIAHYQKETVISPTFGQIDQPSPEVRRVVWRDCGEDQAVYWRWEQPRLGCHYLVTVDTAEGEDQTKGEDPDRHSVLVLRRAYVDRAGRHWKMRVVARIRPPNRVPIHALVDMTNKLSLYYGNAMVIVEMNNTGLAFLVGAKMKGMNLWKRQDVNPQSGKTEEKFGWRTSDTQDYGGLRTLILDRLHSVLRNQEIWMHCRNIVLELSRFVETKGKKQAGAGAHDDDVMSLAIGVYNIDAASAYEEELVSRSIPKDLRHLYDDDGNDALAMRT